MLIGALSHGACASRLPVPAAGTQQRQLLRATCARAPVLRVLARYSGGAGSRQPPGGAKRGGGRGRQGGGGGGNSGQPGSGGSLAKQLNSKLRQSADVASLMRTVQQDQHAAYFDHIHVATAFMAAAKLHSQGRPVPAACTEQLVLIAKSHLQNCGTQALGNMAWALAKLGHGNKHFMQQLLEHAGPKLSEFAPQALANTAWAMATLQYEDRQFMQQLLTHARPKLSEFIPQELTNTAWAMAVLQYQDEQFMQQLLMQLRNQLDACGAQNIGNVLWALAKLDHRDSQFIEQLLPLASRQLSEFVPQSLVNSAWALATLRYQDTRFMEHLLQHAEEKLQTFSSQDAANITWALARFDHQDAMFVNSLVQQVPHVARSITTQGVGNMLWGLSKLDHDAAAAVKPLVALACTSMLSPGAAPLSEQLTQVHQYLLTMEDAGHITQQMRAQSSYQQLRSACNHAWLQQVERIRHRPNPVSEPILQALRSLPGCGDAQLIQLTEDEQVKIEIAVRLACGSKVAVEVELPEGFMWNAPAVPIGSLIWRRRMLRARGWSVVSVRTAAWEQLGSDTQRQQDYLLQRFKEAGVMLPST